MKLAFIVQRYGREILGGSETLARQLAERLSRRHEITVATTTAKDYITWKNEYKPGEEKHRGVRVVRFPVDGERDIDDFNKFSEGIYQGEPTREQELEWLERQGPVSPELIEYLKKEHGRFDLLVFFTYLYYPTYYGLQVAPEKSVLVPTAHDEPPLKLGIFKEMFQLPSSYLFNTEAEELLVLERFPVHKKMRETIGMGMELLDQPDPSIFRKRHAVSANYFLYAGRIDGGKGLEELFRYFSFYKEEHPASGNLELILIGKLGMKLPNGESIRYVGFVDEAEKLSAMAGAVAVFQPSKMESLSIVTLEAFAVATPVIANAASRVLIDHCRKSNAGFYYRDFEEFEEMVGLLLSDQNLARNLGKNGQRYIKENYGWQKVLSKYEHALRSSARSGKEPKDARRGDRAEPERHTAGEEAEPVEAKKPEAATEPTGPTEPTEPTENTTPEPSQAPQEESAHLEAVSESTDHDVTLATVETAETAEIPELHLNDLAESTEPKDKDVSADRAEQVVVEPELPPKPDEPSDPVETSAPSESTEPTPPEPPEPKPQPKYDEPEEEEVDEDVAHLPSFFRASIPPRKHEPVAKQEPSPAKPPEEPRPKPASPPPPPPPADGGLPEFFRPKPKSDPASKPESEEASERSDTGEQKANDAPAPESTVE